MRTSDYRHYPDSKATCSCWCSLLLQTMLSAPGPHLSTLFVTLFINQMILKFPHGDGGSVVGGALSGRLRLIVGQQVQHAALAHRMLCAAPHGAPACGALPHARRSRGALSPPPRRRCRRRVEVHTLARRHDTRRRVFWRQRGVNRGGPQRRDGHGAPERHQFRGHGGGLYGVAQREMLPAPLFLSCPPPTPSQFYHHGEKGIQLLFLLQNASPLSHRAHSP